MSERDGLGVGSETSSSSTFLTQTAKVLIESAKIFLRNKQTFFSIFALTTLPLAALQASLAVSSRPVRARVAGLETLARVASTRFEARHVWRESRSDAVSLLYAKSLLLLPCLALSLLAAVSAVSFAALAAAGKTPTLRSAAADLRPAWKRPLATSVLVHALLLAYSHARNTLAAAFPGLALIPAVGSAVEIYLMAVTSLAIVVSIAEERFGADAIRVGSGIMEGRRVCAWVLSGLFALATGSMSRRFEKAAMVMDGEDLSRTLILTVDIIGGNFWLVILYGFVILFSYVVFTVFYCECCSNPYGRRWHGNRGESESEIEAVSVQFVILFF